MHVMSTRGVSEGQAACLKIRNVPAGCRTCVTAHVGTQGVVRLNKRISRKGEQVALELGPFKPGAICIWPLSIPAECTLVQKGSLQMTVSRPETATYVEGRCHEPQPDIGLWSVTLAVL